MHHPDSRPPRVVLQEIGQRVMRARGLEPEFSAAALAELAGIPMAAPAAGPAARDLRALQWCSIDNDDSRDLDQLSVAEALPGDAVKILVAVADVAALVRPGSALDAHARLNTTSVYTAARIFPMLPEKLSTDLTSLNPAVDRAAMVVEMVFSAEGALQASGVYAALVYNRAKLAYDSVAAWLEERGPVPPAVAAVPGLDANLRLQDRTAQLLRTRRHERGALSFVTLETRPRFDGDTLQDFEAVRPNRAKHLIEDFMVAANGVTARFLAAKKFPSIRRVVRTPARWDRIVALAAAHGARLPAVPDAMALEKFLCTARLAAPAHFADLSLSVIKLMGPGEYVLELPGQDAPGHFGLAVRDYTHSTAPNRRFPDLITQRLLKAALAGGPPPYGNDELAALAKHCTEQEDAAKKVERQVMKSAAAMLLQGRIGERFEGIVTGVTDAGTWVRVVQPPVEGKLETDGHRPEVGDRVRVQLVRADVERGFIDFRLLG